MSISESSQQLRMLSHIFKVSDAKHAQINMAAELGLNHLSAPIASARHDPYQNVDA